MPASLENPARATRAGHGADTAIDPEITRAIRLLGSRRESDRQRAVEVLRTAGPEAVGGLVALLDRESRLRGVWSRRLEICVGASLVVAWLRWRLPVGGKVPWPWAWMLVPTLVCVLGWRHRSVTRAVAQLEDVRTVGALLDAIAVGDEAVEDAVRPALIRLLPELTAADRAVLTPNRLLWLYHLLDTVTDIPLRVTILDTLRRFGDGHALPHVRRLVNDRRLIDRRVRDAAWAVLPIV